MGLTSAEKILSEKAGRTVRAGEFAVCAIDFAFSHDANRPQSHALFEELAPGSGVFDPDRAVLISDHAPTTPNVVAASVQRGMEEFCRRHGMTYLRPGSGISHQVLPELGYVVPGDLVLGTDSHTCTQGAFNLMACGVGSTDMAAALATGRQWFRVPETIAVRLHGRLQPGVYAKDIALALVGRLRADGATYAALEVGGDGLAGLDVGARMTIANLGVEMGAKTVIMAHDEQVAGWYAEHAPRREPAPVEPDADARYAQVVEIDLDALSPQVAAPHEVDNVVPVEEVAGTPIDQGIVGTCANGRFDDLAVTAGIVGESGVHPGVSLYCTPASREVMQQAIGSGVFSTLVAAGAVMGVPGCTGCTGGSFTGIPADGQRVISSANRNFRGRLGNREAFTYLASPATVAASVRTGVITDPREVIGR